MRTLRGAIIGYGNVAAEAHVPGFRAAKGFALSAVVDPSEERRAAAAAALPEARVVADLAGLAGVKLDFVDVATPPAFHAENVIAALERGWHVLCEKPLAIDTPAVVEIADAARRTGKTVFTVHNWKYAPLFQRLRGLVARGAVGEVQEVEWRVLRPNPPAGATADGRTWRTERTVAGGGILADHGWHAFYLMLFLFGRAPRTVTGRVWNARPGELAVEDSAEATLDFESAVARLSFTWAAAERKTGGRVRGTAGTIEIADDALEVRVEGRDPQALRFSPSIAASSYHPEWFPPLLEDFRAEMLHLDRRGQNLAEAVRCAEMLAAAYASNGSPIELGAAGDADAEAEWR